jgi:hypothetical protein
MIKTLKHRITKQIKINSIKKLSNPFSSWHLFYYLVYFQKTNYEFGGFKNYKFGVFQYLKGLIINNRKNVSQKIIELNQPVEIEKNDTKNKFDFQLKESVSINMRVITLFPSTYGRLVTETKSPLLLNLIESAKAAGIYLYDYRSDIISDYAKFHDIEQIKKEWIKISKIISAQNISTLIILGHKNSFSDINGIELLNLKQQYNLTTLVYLTDNWNITYQNLIKNWSVYADYIISYDYQIFKELPEHLRNKIIVWSNGPVPMESKVDINSSEKFTIYIGGTCYLNRWAWSCLISQWHKIYRAKINLNFDFNLQPIVSNSRTHRSIAEYRESYTNKNLATVHFLERHPGIFSLVGSVFEGFARGALVIVQTNKEDDPLSKFFIPGKDYLVFSNLEELISILEMLEEFPENGSLIAWSGFEKYKKTYEPVKVWEQLASNL